MRLEMFMGWIRSLAPCRREARAKPYVTIQRDLRQAVPHGLRKPRDLRRASRSN